jgi:hypothetical protein
VIDMHGRCAQHALLQQQNQRSAAALRSSNLQSVKLLQQLELSRQRVREYEDRLNASVLENDALIRSNQEFEARVHVLETESLQQRELNTDAGLYAKQQSEALLRTIAKLSDEVTEHKLLTASLDQNAAEQHAMYMAAEQRAAENEATYRKIRAAEMAQHDAELEKRDIAITQLLKQVEEFTSRAHEAEQVADFRSKEIELIRADARSMENDLIVEKRNSASLTGHLQENEAKMKVLEEDVKDAEHLRERLAEEQRQVQSAGDKLHAARDQEAALREAMIALEQECAQARASKEKAANEGHGGLAVGLQPQQLDTPLPSPQQLDASLPSMATALQLQLTDNTHPPPPPSSSKSEQPAEGRVYKSRAGRQERARGLHEEVRTEKQTEQQSSAQSSAQSPPELCLELEHYRQHPHAQSPKRRKHEREPEHEPERTLWLTAKLLRVNSTQTSEAMRVVDDVSGGGSPAGVDEDINNNAFKAPPQDAKPQRVQQLSRIRDCSSNGDAKAGDWKAGDWRSTLRDAPHRKMVARTKPQVLQVDHEQSEDALMDWLQQQAWHIAALAGVEKPAENSSFESFYRQSAAVQSGISSLPNMPGGAHVEMVGLVHKLRVKIATALVRHGRQVLRVRLGVVAGHEEQDVEGRLGERGEVRNGSADGSLSKTREAVRLYLANMVSSSGSLRWLMLIESMAAKAVGTRRPDCQKNTATTNRSSRLIDRNRSRRRAPVRNSGPTLPTARSGEGGWSTDSFGAAAASISAILAECDALWHGDAMFEKAARAARDGAYGRQRTKRGAGRGQKARKATSRGAARIDGSTLSVRFWALVGRGVEGNGVTDIEQLEVHLCQLILLAQQCYTFPEQNLNQRVLCSRLHECLLYIAVGSVGYA